MQVGIPFLFTFPDHEGGLFLSHNSHQKEFGDNIAKWMNEHKNDKWVSEYDKESATVMNEVWSLQWYEKVTDIHIQTIHAASLRSLVVYLWKNYS